MNSNERSQWGKPSQNLQNAIEWADWILEWRGPEIAEAHIVSGDLPEEWKRAARGRLHYKATGGKR